MAFTTITVTATYVMPDGSVPEGYVTFQPTAAMANGTKIVPASPISVSLDSSGHFSVALDANDDSGTVPSGVAYAVTEDVGGVSRTYNVVIPSAASGGTIDLSALAPSTTTPNWSYIQTPDSLTAGYYLQWNGSQWVMAAGGGGGGGGSTWYNGTAAPSTLHSNGDYYLRTTTGDVYQQTSGAWGSPIANLTGPTGSAGATGATGATGASGGSLTQATYSGVATISASNQLAIANGSSGGYTLTLPASPSNGDVVIVLNGIIGGGAVQVNANSGQQIAGVTGGTSGAVNVPSVGESVTLYYKSTGSTWYPGAAADLALVGDVTGTLSGASVTRINNSPLGTTTGASTNDVLTWNGSAWTHATPTSGGITAVTGDVTASGSGSVAAAIVPQSAISRGQDVTSRGGASGAGSLFSGVPYRTTAGTYAGVAVSTIVASTVFNVAAAIGGGAYYGGLKQITVVTNGSPVVFGYTGTTATSYTGITLVSGSGSATVTTGAYVTHQANIVPDLFMGASITRGDGGVLGSTDWATLLCNTENNLAGLVPQGTGFVYPVYTDGAFGGLQWNVNSGSGITQTESGALAPMGSFPVTAVTTGSTTTITDSNGLLGFSLISGQQVTLQGIGSTVGSLTGTFTATVTSSTTFTVPVNTTGSTITLTNAIGTALYPSSINVAYNSATVPSDNRTFRRVLLFFKNQTNGDKITFATTGVVASSGALSTNNGTGYGVWDSGDLGSAGAGTGWTATPSTNGTGSHAGVNLIGALYIQSAGTNGSVNINISKGGSSTTGWSTYMTNWSAFVSFLTTIGFTPRRAFTGDIVDNNSFWGVDGSTPSTVQTNLQTIVQKLQGVSPLTEVVLFATWNVGITGTGVGAAAWGNSWVPAIRNAAINSGSTFVDAYARFGDLYQNRTVTDGVANGTTTYTSATASFTSPADVGTPITGPLIPPNTAIQSVTNGTTVVMSQAATGSGSSQTTVIGGDRWGLTQDNIHMGSNLTSASGRNGQQAFTELFFEKLAYSQAFAISGQVESGAPADGAIKTLIAYLVPGGSQVGLYTNSADTQPTVMMTSVPGLGQGIAFGPGGNTAVDGSILRAGGGVMQVNTALIVPAIAVTVASNAGTVAVNAQNAKFTNNSAAAMTILLSVSGAVDGMTKIVRIYDATNATQTINWSLTPSGTATISGTTTLTLAGANFTPAMNGMVITATAGTGSIAAGTTITYVSSTVVTLSAAGTNGNVTAVTLTCTENSTATVPTTSNGSTKNPLTVVYQFNGVTGLWRCATVW